MARGGLGVLRKWRPWGAGPAGRAAASPSEARDALSQASLGNARWRRAAGYAEPLPDPPSLHLPSEGEGSLQGPWGQAWGVQIRGKAGGAGSLLRPSRVISALSSWKPQMGQEESHRPASSVSPSLAVPRRLVFFPDAQSCLNSQVQAGGWMGPWLPPHRALSAATRHTVGAVHVCP